MTEQKQDTKDSTSPTGLYRNPYSTTKQPQCLVFPQTKFIVETHTHRASPQLQTPAQAVAGIWEEG